MRRLPASLLFVAALLSAAGCNSAPPTNQTTANANARPAATAATPVSSAPAAPTDEFAATRATYAQFCIACHKPDGTGGIRELDDGTKLKVPSFREGHALEHTDADFARQIANGGDGMPAFKNRLDQQRIDALVRFIRHEFQGKTAGNNNNQSPPAPAH